MRRRLRLILICSALSTLLPADAMADAFAVLISAAGTPPIRDGAARASNASALSAIANAVQGLQSFPEVTPTFVASRDDAGRGQQHCSSGVAAAALPSLRS